MFLDANVQVKPAESITETKIIEASKLKTRLFWNGCKSFRLSSGCIALFGRLWAWWRLLCQISLNIESLVKREGLLGIKGFQVSPSSPIGAPNKLLFFYRVPNLQFWWRMTFQHGFVENFTLDSNFELLTSSGLEHCKILHYWRDRPTEEILWASETHGFQK